MVGQHLLAASRGSKRTPPFRIAILLVVVLLVLLLVMLMVMLVLLVLLLQQQPPQQPNALKRLLSDVVWISAAARQRETENAREATERPKTAAEKRQRKKTFQITTGPNYT